MATEASTSVNLVGRLAVVDGEVATVTALRGAGVVTTREPCAVREGETVVVLPVIGELVELSDVRPGGETVRGYWLGLVEEELARVSGATFAVLVLSDSSVQRMVLPVDEVDARRVVKGRATEGELVVMGALLSEARAHQRARRDHATWRSQLVSEAHCEADDREWCSEFDDFMERVGLPRKRAIFNGCNVGAARPAGGPNIS